MADTTVQLVTLFLLFVCSPVIASEDAHQQVVIDFIVANKQDKTMRHIKHSILWKKYKDKAK